MKKTFPLTAPGKADARVRDKIRQELNNYVRREGAKTLPEGFTRWTFECRIGRDAETAEPRPLKELGGAIDRVAEAGAPSVYLEAIAKAEVRRPLG